MRKSKRKSPRSKKQKSRKVVRRSKKQKSRKVVRRSKRQKPKCYQKVYNRKTKRRRKSKRTEPSNVSISEAEMRNKNQKTMEDIMRTTLEKL